MTLTILLIYEDFTKFLDEFQERGSGFVFKEVSQLEIRAYRMKGFRGSSYIPTPFKSSNIINVQNKKITNIFFGLS